MVLGNFQAMRVMMVSEVIFGLLSESRKESECITTTINSAAAILYIQRTVWPQAISI